MRPARVSHQTPSVPSRHKAMLLSALAENREGEGLDVSQRTEWTQSVCERNTEYSSQAKRGEEVEERGMEGKDWIFCPKVPMEGWEGEEEEEEGKRKMRVSLIVQS